MKGCSRHCHLEVGKDIVGGEDNAAGFGGWTLDNNRTNMAALKILEESQEQWCNQGCISQGLSLSIKHLCTFTTTAGLCSVRLGCRCLAEVTAFANTIANYIQDSGNGKAILYLSLIHI